MLGGSPVMAHLRREIDLVARSDFTVLVLEETGVGKELVVRAIHGASLRREAPLLYLNCASLPETLAESELFGHTKGAFTGAGRDRAGKFELADKGTLFLGEIGELPLSVQPKLLRAIQEGEIQRVGSSQTAKVKEFKRDLIRAALNRNHGNWAATTRDLHMHRSNLHNLVNRLGLKPQLLPHPLKSTALRLPSPYAFHLDIETGHANFLILINETEKRSML